MPELPEVETVVRGLRPHLEGAVITRVVQRRANLRFPFPEDFCARIEGRTVTHVGRRAKFMLMTLDNGTIVIGHLGMSGRMLILTDNPPPPGPHDHVDFVTGAGTIIRYCDPRRFGLFDLSTQATLGEHRMLRDLGPEPLGNEFNVESLSAALTGRRTPIKAALLDQKTVAGLGNIYICEALYRAAISPRRAARTIPGKRAERLTTAIRAVLGEAIEAGGSSLRNYVQTSGELGYFQHRWNVYGREGEPCPKDSCAGRVQRITQSGRSTFFCATHQR
ncbi:MAG: bifunctional DNA-formamidopyrimidine glycosylase/DNA-(apurinic or apyrimidinic site) lyase [Rhodospirillaceae bacterium]|jgi:formamidopyrimidine-DNA glycosylase|nr:bifunctional DNA-formamidopyrimidine glycosylase/DNA-(apurinic or apyrimidinic site) lyase [Rhodospirillaceae bacterium]MBT5665517.1 bifunctional DNA-formamidopyrimidine glycosylase/DNA-(apurinic or apyrimidinic site) lyase [Rhodospirillaceae bacterium]MBT5809046.1 bifunctional DNA-formamidopyrimidine glycosylase/DNA-(apurinic or apyrimidinic site) lyase [Rhodospirillaceae bacterium]